MQAAFLKAAVQEPFTILGRKLKPFSLGHAILLARFESAFALTSKELPCFDDLILSVLICSHDFDGAIKSLSSRLLPLKLRAWGWLCGKFDIQQKLKMFERYVRQGSEEPLFWSGAEGGGASGAPLEQHIINWLTARGYSETEAINYPYSKAVWAFATDAESKGAISLWSDRDYQDVAKLKSMQRKKGENVVNN